MNTEQMDNIITVEEYTQLLNKEEELTPQEQIQVNSFENFIKNCEKYSNYLSPAVERIYSQYQKELAKIYTKEKRTKNENKVLVKFENQILKTENEENNVVNFENENQYTRKLTNKAGYVNATIILVMILNIGFIIAMALLGSK